MLSVRESKNLLWVYIFCFIWAIVFCAHPIFSVKAADEPEVRVPSKTECMMILDAVSMMDQDLAHSYIFLKEEKIHQVPLSADLLSLERTPEASPNIWGVNMTDEEIYTLLEACSQYEDVPVSMALAVIREESRFNRDIISADGHDYGFFQIRDSNHQWLQDTIGCDPKTPLGNIKCGVYMPSAKLKGFLS